MMKKNLWKGMAVPALVVAALLGLSGFAPADDDDAAGYPKIVKEKELHAENDFRGKKAPKLVVEDWLTGGKPETKGKILLIDFWATWCGPCREGIPEMNEWAKKFGKDLVIVGLTNEKAETVNEFMEGTAINYYVATDTKSRVSKQLGVRGIPHVMVVSADGIVRWQGLPGLAADKLTEAKIAQIIAQSKKDYAASIGK